MKNILTIAQREYLVQIRKKSFIVMTFLSPLLVLGFGVLVATLFVANESDYTIYIADNPPDIAEFIHQKDPKTYPLVPIASLPSLRVALRETDKFDGILILSDPSNTGQNTQLITNKTISKIQQERLSNLLAESYRDSRVRQLHLSPEDLKYLDEPVNLQVQNIKSSSEDSGISGTIKASLAFVLVYVTFMFIIMYGVRVMRSVLEEKSNRVIEIIISSVRPFELMLGKIIGVTGVALTQFACWILISVIGAIFLSRTSPTAPLNPPLEQNILQQIIPIIKTVSIELLNTNYIQIISVFILFFIFGYLLYSAIYSAIAAAVDSETETQQFTIFSLLPLTLGMYASFSIINHPDGPMAFWISMFPFTSPVAMVARIPFGVPLWQILLSLFILVTTMLAMVWMAARIYRIGILAHGSKPSLKQLARWIRG